MTGPGRELTKIFSQIFARLVLVSFLEFNLHEYINLIPYKSYIYKYILIKKIRSYLSRSPIKNSIARSRRIWGKGKGSWSAPIFASGGRNLRKRYSASSSARPKASPSKASFVDHYPKMAPFLHTNRAEASMKRWLTLMILPWPWCKG